jgi:DeoR/GlpR family transcriptional regulator of sugar metabolism
VIAEGFVRIEQLAEEFAVNVMTSHRDLNILQKQGLLRKTRGGTTTLSTVFYKNACHHRDVMKETKEELARAAINLLQPGQSVLLDERSTIFYLATVLPSRTPITAITYSLEIAKLLAEETGIDLIVTGGSYHAAYKVFLGPDTALMLLSLRTDILFMSTTAIINGVCYHPSQGIVSIIKKAYRGCKSSHPGGRSYEVTMMKNPGVSVQVAHSENGKQQEYCIQVE